MAETSTTGMCLHGNSQQFYLNKSLIGLDPIFRSHVKMRIKDCNELHLVDVGDADKTCDKTELYCFKNHIINKIEVLGIVVMVNSKEKFISFAVDDGTGVILCVQWKKIRNDSKPDISDGELPTSLQLKYEELKSKDEEYPTLGDLVKVRGWISTYRDQKEIIVLDYRIIDNPCVEVNAVLEYPTLYKIYDQPFQPPSALVQEMAALSANTFNEFTVQKAISSHIQNCRQLPTTVTSHDILLWPSVMTLIQGLKKEDVGTNQEYINIIKLALKSLETNKGSVYQLSGTSDTYEIITAQCPMAEKVLDIIKITCQIKKNSEDGCHVNHLKGQFKKFPKYSTVQDQVMMYLLSCMEDTSDVVRIDANSYICVSQS